MHAEEGVKVHKPPNPYVGRFEIGRRLAPILSHFNNYKNISLGLGNAYGWRAFRRGLATNHGLGVKDKTIQAILRH